VRGVWTPHPACALTGSARSCRVRSLCGEGSKSPVRFRPSEAHIPPRQTTIGEAERRDAPMRMRLQVVLVAIGIVAGMSASSAEPVAWSRPSPCGPSSCAIGGQSPHHFPWQRGPRHQHEQGLLPVCPRLVALAGALMVQQQDVKAFESLSNQALAINPDTQRKTRLQNLILQRRARWLLSEDGTVPDRLRVRRAI